MPLENVAKQLAKGYFSEAYHYEYHELDYNKVRPPKSLGKNQSAHAFCNMEATREPFSAQLCQRLFSDVIDKLDLPNWVRDPAKGDFMRDTSFIDDETDNQWKYRKYTRFYEPRTEDDDSYQCDAIMLYCHGVARGAETTASIGMVYFAGICYTMLSESKKIRNLMCKEAMESAAAISEGGIVPHTMTNLKEILEGYAARKFETKFGYRYTDDSPTSLRAIGVAPALSGRTSTLLYFENDDVDKLKEYLKNRVLKRINVPFEDIRERMIDELFQPCMSILQDTGRTWSWQKTFFDKVYAVHEHHDKFRQSGLLVSRRAEKVMENGVKIVEIYIYIMHVQYDELKARDQLPRKIFSMLNDAELEMALPSHAKMRWNDAFGFPFQDNKTQPPDMITNSKVKSYAVSVAMEGYPTSSSDLEQWMNTRLFRRDSWVFPPSVNPQIYDYTRDHILNYHSAVDSGRAVNTWHILQQTKEFICDGKPDELKYLKYYGLFFYALGEIEDDMVPDGVADAPKIRRLFGYYLMAVCSPQK